VAEKNWLDFPRPSLLPSAPSTPGALKALALLAGVLFLILTSLIENVTLEAVKGKEKKGRKNTQGVGNV